MTETFEIKVYEIDDVERLQKKRDKVGNKVRRKEDVEREMMEGARKDVYEKERLNDGGG